MIVPPRRYTLSRRKIVSLSRLLRDVRKAQAQGECVVFTNGCFDLLHAGHVTLLERSRALGNLLVVAINSDRSVRFLKGKDRPIVSERDRAILLAGLACVDYVIVFDEPTPKQLINRLKPNILVKGGDWDIDHIVGRQTIERAGGRVVCIPLLKGHSTSRLIERIRQKSTSASFHT